jgi:uncharacterized protein HemX
MGCQFRTIRAGSAALGLSVVVASVTWQSVLLMFMATGLGFSFWSWRKDRNKQKQKQEKQQLEWAKVKAARAHAERQFAARNQNVYHLRYPMPVAYTRD